MDQPVSFVKKLALFDEHWSPKIIAQMNDYQFKLVKVSGEFVWHDHSDTDETFIVLDGQLYIDFRDQQVSLQAGEMLVVPKGVEHKPWTKKRMCCWWNPVAWSTPARRVVS